MSTVIDLLTSQHREVLARIERDRNHFEDACVAGRFLDFLEGEVVGHFNLEEVALFPELTKIARIANGPLRVMEAEHAIFRDVLSAGKAAREHGDHRKLQEAVTELAAVLEAHIAKEDRVLFPMALDTLSEEQLRRVDDAGHHKDRV